MRCPAPQGMRSPSCSPQIAESIAAEIVLKAKQLATTDIHNKLPLRRQAKCHGASATSARSGVSISYVSLDFGREIEFKGGDSKGWRNLHESGVTFSQRLH